WTIFDDQNRFGAEGPICLTSAAYRGIRDRKERHAWRRSHWRWRGSWGTRWGRRARRQLRGWNSRRQAGWLWAAGAKEIDHWLSAGGVPKRAHAPGILNRAQQRVMRVGNRRLKARLTKRRDDERGNLAATAGVRAALVKGDEQHATPLPGRRRQDARYPGFQPAVGGANPAIVRAVAHVWRDPDIVRQRVGLQICRELRERHNVAAARLIGADGVVVD